MRLDLSSRTDGELLREFSALVEVDRSSTSDLLAYVGEIDARKLYVPAGYSSMYSYCVRALHMSEDMAYKRIQAARASRRFPVILDMVADGRLHLTAVVRLWPWRLARDFPELLEAAAHRTKKELDLLLAERFPQADVPCLVQPLATSTPCQKLVPEPVVQTHESGVPAASASTPLNMASSDAISVAGELATPDRATSAAEPPTSEPSATASAQQFPRPVERARVQPLAPQRYALQVTLDQETYDLLRRAQDLHGHSIPAGDVAEVLKRALRDHVSGLERAKFAATEKPRPARQRSTVGKRHVPAAVKRAVHERDGGQCAFVSDSGHRCEERRDLQYDHIEPFARGGEATVKGMRLLCPAHNQHEADRVYGGQYMERKRGASQ